MKKTLLGLFACTLLACATHTNTTPAPPTPNDNTHVLNQTETPKTGFSRDGWRLDVDKSQWILVRLDRDVLMLHSAQHPVSLMIAQKEFTAPLRVLTTMMHDDLIRAGADAIMMNDVVINNTTASRMLIQDKVGGAAWMTLFATGHKAIIIGCGGSASDKAANEPFCNEVVSHFYLTE
jgi:hypothetical protein